MCQNRACNDTPGYWPRGGDVRNIAAKAPRNGLKTEKRKDLVQTCWHKQKQELEC